MGHPKTKAATSKLKSSNSAIENKKKAETHKKKSKSNAEIQTLQLKKRGVYVEQNKSIFGRDLDAGKPKLKTADEMKEDSIQEKPTTTKRQQRDHKKFLASVLTILSKSSTGTQQQDASNSKAKKDESKHTVSPIHTTKNIPSVIPSHAPNIDLDKRRRYRSKILNDNKQQVDNCEVLQSKRERFGTSSKSSINDKEDTKWKSELPRLVPPAPDEIEDDVKYKTIVREVTEGNKLAEKKIKVFDPDPQTLVAEQTTLRDDKKLYNFFVDLLQSTFNVYNVNAHFDKEPVPSTVSSKISLEIDEFVAKKLNVGTEMHKNNESEKPFDYSIKNQNDHWNDRFQHNTQYTGIPKHTRVYRESPKSAGKQTKIRKEYDSRRIFSAKSQVADYSRAEDRPPLYRKQKKKDLLHMLKEELKMEPVSFEEPQNLYEALKVMAQQKRKKTPKKKLRFHKKSKKKNEKPPAECQLSKGRKYLLSNKKERNRNDNFKPNYGAIGNKKSELGGHIKILQQSNIREEYSNHSLEVYSFEKFIPKKLYNRDNVMRKQRERLLSIMYGSYPRQSSSSEEL